MMKIQLGFILGLLVHSSVWAEQSQIIQNAPVPVIQRLHAVIEASQQSTVTAQTQGTITAIFYDVNDYVAQGKLLIQLDDTLQQAALKQAQAQVAQAKARLAESQSQSERMTRLVNQKAVSKADYEAAMSGIQQAQGAYQAALAQVTQAKEQLSYTQIHAPYAGIVKQRHVELGESVSVGQPLMSGLSLQSLRAVAQIPQRLLPMMQESPTLSVATEQGQAVPIGEHILFPYADTQSHSSTLRVMLQTTSANPPLLLPGMWVNLYIQSGQRDALLIPQAAVIQRSELSAVYVKNTQGERQLRQIRLGETFNDTVEVLSGLNAGEELVWTQP